MTNAKFSFTNLHSNPLIAYSHSEVWKFVPKPCALYTDYPACTVLPERSMGLGLSTKTKKPVFQKRQSDQNYQITAEYPATLNAFLSAVATRYATEVNSSLSGYAVRREILECKTYRTAKLRDLPFGK